MAKRHWLIEGVIACSTKETSDARVYGITAERFVARFNAEPDRFCILCAKAARLTLAKESEPNPDAVVWPKPRPISEAPKDGSMVLICVPGCDPMWTIGVFDARQRWVDQCLAGASVNPTHFLPLPPSPEVK
jgi:hypothetical protein